MSLVSRAQERKLAKNPKYKPAKSKTKPTCYTGINNCVEIFSSSVLGVVIILTRLPLFGAKEYAIVTCDTAM